MKNVDMKIEGTTLVIRVDLTKRFGLSSTGKTEIIASTAGTAKAGDVSVGLNVFCKPSR